MTRDEIISMAREADMDVDHAESNAWGAIITAEPADLERFAALVAAQEREACAQVCVDAIASIRGFGTEDAKQIGINVCTNLAKAIRARSIT